MLTAKKLEMYHRKSKNAKYLSCVKKAHEKMLKSLIFRGQKLQMKENPLD